jgi:cobalt-zinc-cadmium efflux system outer membrane protein
LVAFGLGVVSPPIIAKPPSQLASVPPSATLKQVVHQVWAASPQIEAARSKVRAAAARAQAEAQPLYNPELSMEAENADVRRRVASLSLTLDLSGKRRAREARGDAGARLSEAEYDRLRRNVSVRWLKAWSGVVLAQRQSELGRKRLRLMQRFDRLAARRLSVGDISSPARDLAGLALGEAQAQLAQLRGEEASARAALQAITGDALITAPPLPEGLPPEATDIVPTPPDALPELRVAHAENARASAGVQVARRARIPDPTVSLTGGRVQSGPISDRVIGLNVSIPLPVRNTGRAEVSAARAEADAAVAELRSQRLLVKARLHQARVRYDALREAGTAFRSSRAGAYEERTDLLERLWRAGEIGTSDYLVQLKQSLDTALSGLQLQQRAWRAWFDYLSSAGRLVDWIEGTTPNATQDTTR